MSKPELKVKVIHLRKQGMSYREIRRLVHVSKSTLSRWLKNIPLTSDQLEALEDRTTERYERQAITVRETWRQKRQNAVDAKRTKYANIELDKNALALVGAALYWSEGSRDIRSNFVFVNSDPAMHRLYLRWLYEVLEIPIGDVICRVYVHLNNGIPYEEIEQYWIRELGLPESTFRHPVVNRIPQSSKLTKKHKLVYGVLRIQTAGAAEAASRYTVLVEKLGKKTTFIKGA